MFRVRLTFHLPKAPSKVPTGVSLKQHWGDPSSALMVSNGHCSPWESVDRYQGRRKVVDTAGQDSTRLPTAPGALRQMPVPAWLTHPADMSPIPTAGQVGWWQTAADKTSTSKDPGVPLPIHSNSWKGIKTCQAALRSQDS